MAGESQLQAKRPVSASLAGPYGHPFHPVLVTVPIGAWTTGLVLAIASRVVHRPGFPTRSSRWPIAVGVIGALPVALPGFVVPARWIPVRRDRTTAGAPTAAPVQGAAGTVPAERHFPVPVVLAHGLFAAVTLAPVLLTALGIGGT